MIDVVTIDDHYLTREGIKTLVNNTMGMHIVAEGCCGEEVFEMVAQFRPHVLLLDIIMPQYKGQNGGVRFQIIPTLHRLATEYPQMKIIIISMDMSALTINTMISAGVRGYLLKDDPLSLLLPEAIRTVRENGLFISQRLRDMIQNNPESDSTLTPRQTEIAKLILKYPDISTQELANLLNITLGSLRNQKAEMYTRLSVSNMTACVIECIRRRIIDIGDMAI